MYINVDFIPDPERGVAVARVSASENGLSKGNRHHLTTGVGSSRLNPEDNAEFSEEIARNLSTARALRDLARQLEADARYHINRDEAARRTQREANERRRARSIEKRPLKLKLTDTTTKPLTTWDNEITKVTIY